MDTPEDQGGTGVTAEAAGPSGRPQRRTRRALTGVAVAAAVGVGGLTVAALNPLADLGAEGDPTTTAPAATSTVPEVPAPAPAPDPDPDPDPGRSPGGTEHGARQLLDQALDALVANGTITRAQADAVKAEVATRAEAARAERRGEWDARRQEMLDAAASVFGLTGEQLAEELKAGKTLDQLATEHGVDAQKISDALVSGANERIDAAVADGHIDAARAAELKEKFVERIPDLVDAGAVLFGGRG